MIPRQWFELTSETKAANIIEEFCKKYKDCFVWYKSSADSLPVLAQFSGCDHDVFFFRYKGMDITCKLDTDVEIMANFPEPGAFSYKNNYFVFQRIPARQYKRAPQNGNCQITLPYVSLDVSLATRTILKQSPISGETLEAAYKKSFVSYSSILKQLNDKKIDGAAINKKFGITKGVADTANILWFETYPVGFAHADKIEVFVPELKQEVLDFVRDENIKVKVNDKNL